MKSQFLRRFIFALILVCIAEGARAQLWKSRLVVEPDSLTFSTIDGRYAYNAASRNYRFLSDSTLSPNISQASFCEFYRQDNKRIVFRPIENVPQWQYQSAFDENYRLPSGVVAEKTFLSETGLFDQLMRQHTIDFPMSVSRTWSEVPETYKISSIKQDKSSELRNIARQLEGKRNLQTSMRALPKEKESPWTISGENNAQFSQLFLSNWSTGGESSITLSFDCRVKALYKYDKHQWESNLVHKLGFTYTSTLKGRTSDDEFNLTSKYGYQAAGSKWYYSLQTSFKTQLFRSYSSSDTEKTTPKSAFFTPAYWKIIFGMDYKKDDLSVLISPYTYSLTIVTDTTHVDKSNFGIEGDTKTKGQSGFSVTSTWKYRITTEITYNTSGELFYEYSGKGGTRQFDWENIIDVQVNRFLTTRLLLKLRYFNNESSKFQVKENFCVAFKFSF